MNGTNEAEKEWYYVTYQGAGVGGASVIPQFKLANGAENPDGFNIAEATRFLFNNFGVPMIIQSWRVITDKRRAEFEAFVAEAHGQPAPPKEKVSHLQLVTTPQ